MIGDRLTLMMPAPHADWARSKAAAIGLLQRTDVVNTLAELDESIGRGSRRVIGFGTGLIVPARILDVPGMRAINIHAASPDFPGRDPHHFAAYESARVYGATMHHMIRRVDAGPIIMVELRPVAREPRPEALLAMGNDCGRVLVERLFEHLAHGTGVPAPDPALRWSGTVGTRKRFLELCRLDASMDRAEVERRIRACSMPGHLNLHLDLHGHRFWYQPERQR